MSGGGSRPGVVMEVTDVVMEVTDEVMEVAKVATLIVPLAGYSVVSMGIDGNVPESISLVEAGMVLVFGTNWSVTLEHELEPKDCGYAVAVERLVAEEVFVVVYVMSPEVEF